MLSKVVTQIFQQLLSDQMGIRILNPTACPILRKMVRMFHQTVAQLLCTIVSRMWYKMARQIFHGTLYQMLHQMVRDTTMVSRMPRRIVHQTVMDQQEVLAYGIIQKVNCQMEFSGLHGIGSPIISTVSMNRLRRWVEGVMAKYSKYDPFNHFSDCRLLISSPGSYNSPNVCSDI